VEYSEKQLLGGNKQEMYLQVAEGCFTKLQVRDQSRNEKVLQQKERNEAK